VEYIKKNSTLLLVFLLSLLPILNLLTPGLLITHDSIDHVARVANFYQSLSDGNIIPRWAGNLNWGYGHPILMFLYPLPSYAMSFFHFLDISFVNSFKLLIGISYSLSGIFMYLWLSRFLNKYAASAGAILYLFAPYRFVDLYVRGAIGEHVAFVFMPLTLLCIYNIFKIKKIRIKDYYFKIVLTSISFAFLILSHNAISLFFIPFIVFYIFYLYIEDRSIQKLILSFLSIGIGFLYSFFFWFPAFIEGKYTLRDIVTSNEYSSRFVAFKDFIYSNWSFGGTGELTTQLGLIQILLIIASIIFLFKFYKSKDKIKYLLIGTLIFLFASCFLMTKESSFIWANITTLKKLQFPWRLLTMTTFCTSLIGAIYLDKIKIKAKNILAIFIIFLAIIPTIFFWHAKEYKVYSESYFTSAFSSTTDTGESSPIWSVRSMDNFPKNNLEIIEGESNIKTYIRRSNYHEYLIETNTKTRFRENTLYFPGWNIYDNYKAINTIEYQDPANRGVMTFYLDKGLHDLIIKFEDTKVRKISNYVSIVSITFTLIFLFIVLFFPNLKIGKYKW